MRFPSTLAAAFAGLIAANSFAAFTFTTARTAINGSLDRVNLLVGADSPTIAVAVASVDLTAVGSPNGLKFAFNNLGNPVVYPATDESTYTAGGADPGNRLTYGGFGFGAITIATPNPSVPDNKPLFEDGLGSINYVTLFTTPFVNNTADVGRFVLASAVVPTGTAVNFTGNIDDDLSNENGNTPIVVITEPPPPGDHMVTIAPVAPVAVVFGPTVSNGAPFTATIHATDISPTDVLSLTIGTLPPGIHNVTFSGIGVSPATFTVTGIVDYTLNQTTAQIPFNVLDGFGEYASSTITLVITPEPTSLSAIAAMGILQRRRRRR